MRSLDFGPNFNWGVATSAYQTEGAVNQDGKGLSIWDVYVSAGGKIKRPALQGCDFYNKYVQDLILMNYMNIRNFRFSVSWPRIFPQGRGSVNPKGLEFYDELIDSCLEMDIQPWVTLYHWDLPYELERRGGWTNRAIIHWFSDYVKTCLDHFGDRVKYWMVLNEPLVFTGAGYFLGIHAPGRKGLQHFIPALHHAALCQSIGAGIIKSYPGTEAGTTFSFSPIHPFSRSGRDAEACRTVDALTNRLFLEPLLGLGYPVGDLGVLGLVEKYMMAGDEQLLAGDIDFIGVQNYTREVVQHARFVPYLKAETIRADKRGVPFSSMNWEIYPEGMYEILQKVGSYKQVKKIIVTENGVALPDRMEDGRVDDPQRISYYESYITQVLRAKKEGVPVEGYFAWSLLDNFEWAEGYDKRFGLVYVDHATSRRHIKSSGHWFRNFLATGMAEIMERMKMGI